MKKRIEEYYATEDGVTFITVSTDVIYETEDGEFFSDEKEALAHEKILKGLRFESKEDIVTHMKKTDTWQKWEKYLKTPKSNVLEFEKAVSNLAFVLNSEYPKVYLTDNKMPVDLEVVIWGHFEPMVMLEFFHEHSEVELPEDRILALYNKAYSEEHSYGISDVLYEFSKYIEVLEIANGLRYE